MEARAFSPKDGTGGDVQVREEDGEAALGGKHGGMPAAEPSLARQEKSCRKEKNWMGMMTIGRMGSGQKRWNTISMIREDI
jgi:hypothetical protein